MQCVCLNVCGGVRVSESEKEWESERKFAAQKKNNLEARVPIRVKSGEKCISEKNSVAEQNESNGKLKPNFKFLCLSERFLAVDASEVKVSS